MSTTVRWVIAAVAAVLIVALLIWARGYVHQKGDETDQSAAAVPTVIR